MSTQFTDTTRDEQETLPQIPVPPQIPAPPRVSPPHPPPRPKGGRWVMIATVILVLAIIVGGGAFVLALVAQRPAAPVKPTPVPTTVPTTVPTPGVTVTPTPEVPTPVPGVLLGPQACPAPMNNPAYWEKIVGTQSGVNHVEGVSCANIVDTPSLQALVTVRANSPAATLDVYVYNNISSAKPIRIFQLQGLLKGDAKISGYNTIMTAEVDKNSALNAGKPLSTMTADLFREFDWSGKQGTLVQTAFPGIFPDLTRYQAEADQALVNKGQDTWKNDPKQVAQKLVVQFFGWHGTLTSTIISGGGAKDVYATVKVVHPIQGTTKPPSVNVTLSRLEGNTHNMWVAIGVEDGEGTLTSVTARSLVASPVKVEGKGDSFGGAIGEVYILDHLYTTVGQAHVSASNGLGPGVSPYSLLVSYDTSFKQGPQEGIVELQLTSTMGPTAYSAVMVKVLLDPQPQVALGPMSCPVAQQDAGYWESNFGISPTTVTCGYLKGPAYITLLALLTVAPSDSKPGHLYVYDLTEARPVQLFSMETSDAKISGASTIITADIDPNSSINKGKSKMTPDLFREFAWSGKDFVQVAFSGMYPDLTRWQAEDDLALVNKGQDTWKRDAVKTAGQFVAQFLPSPASNPPKLQLVFGGGAKDPQAYVNVTFPAAGGGTPRITKITLSRLAWGANSIWEVTAVQADWMSISSPQSGLSTYISTPVTVSGSGPTFEGQIGVAQVLDHLYQQIGWTPVMAPEGAKSRPFTVTFPYTSSFRTGAQEGIVVLKHTGGAPFDYGVVLVKVLVNP